MERGVLSRFHFEAKIINLNLKAVLIFLGDMNEPLCYYFASSENDYSRGRGFIHLFILHSFINSTSIFTGDYINEKVTFLVSQG